MFGRMLKLIFVPKATRAKLVARTGAPKRASTRGPAVVADREHLLQEAMAVYRKQRTVYDSLDEETRRQIDADAAKIFGDALDAKR